MSRRLCFVLFVLLAAGLGTGCKKESAQLHSVSLRTPDGFPAMEQSLSALNLTVEGIALGRRLFYDKQLSADVSVSCGTCHEQRAAFGTFEHDRSHGVFNSHTLRNAPPLFNLLWQKTFHWDGAYRSLTEEAVQPITGATEMGMSFDRIKQYLQDDPSYRESFKKVYGTWFIRPELVTNALSQFTATFISANSKYDRVKQGRAQFDAYEQAGYQLFQQRCASCHSEPLFTDHSFRNIGLPLDPSLNDLGRFLVSRNATDSMKFKVPSLRNVAASANYMHDGRFATVQQVIRHYRYGVRRSTTLDPLLQNGLSMSDADEYNLMQFLKCLTDSSFLQETRLARPF
ncbi:MAG: cytochrome-c peroxidase [Bacteroidetes bacterium]|nr:cytochrome-c peroxidase [Bacteroidota bacterium]